MKKLLLGVFLLVITFSFSGCSFLKFEEKDAAEVFKQQILEEDMLEEELYCDD